VHLLAALADDWLSLSPIGLGSFQRISPKLKQRHPLSMDCHLDVTFMVITRERLPSLMPRAPQPRKAITRCALQLS